MAIDDENEVDEVRNGRSDVESEGEDDEGEIEITINPREEDLDALGIDHEEFESALMKTLDAYDQAIDVEDPDATAPLEDAEIVLGGKTYRLGEVADIEITGGLDLLDRDDDEEEEADAEPGPA